MERFTLKNGLEISIETWNFNQLKDYVSQDIPHHKKTVYSVFDGFSFLGPDTVFRMEKLNDSPYSKARDLSPLEIQVNRKLPNEQYHKSLAAFHGEDLCGIFICQWVKGFWNFWRYHTKFLDVHESYRNLGVGTNLVKALDKADFLDQKILQIGMYTLEGDEYIQKVMQRELKGKRYALIPEDYLLLEPPSKVGVYDWEGKLKG